MTHYEVLGVARSATPDEIRAAYRRAARAAHPDRHGERSAARMAEVNEARRVLGDPARRQRYDLELADGPTATGAQRTASANGSGATAAGGARGATPVAVPTGEFSRFPWRFFTVIGVLAVGVVFVGNAVSDPAPPPPIDNVLVTGECVDILDEATREIRPVACDGTNDAVVNTVVGFDGTCPTGTELFRDPQGRGTACVTRAPRAGG